MATKERSGSESTVEMSLADDVLGITATRDYAGMEIDLVQRHDLAAKALIRKVEAHFEENEDVYSIIPILLADNVAEDVLETIPSLVGNYKVKCMVKNHKLWLVNLSSNEYHTTAVATASAQTVNWTTDLSRGFFTARTDGNTPFSDGNAAAPDAVILISGNRINRRSSAVLVIEVEFSHRTIQDMRRDFLAYFTGRDVVSVVGIKFFPDGQNTCFFYRAAAVIWSRNRGEPVENVTVTAVYDFGVAPLSAQAKRLFSERLNEALPGVPIGAWDPTRCEPVPVGVTNPAAWMGGRESHEDLYSVGLRPVHTFPANTFTQVLQNQNPPLQNLPPLQNFELNLARIIYSVAILH